MEALLDVIADFYQALPGARLPSIVPWRSTAKSAGSIGYCNDQTARPPTAPIFAEFNEYNQLVRVEGSFSRLARRQE